MRLLLLLAAFILSACATPPTAQHNPRIERLPAATDPAPLSAEEKNRLTELNARILQEQEQKITEERERVLRAQRLQQQRDYDDWPYLYPTPYFHGWGPHWGWGYGYRGRYW